MKLTLSYISNYQVVRSFKVMLDFESFKANVEGNLFNF